MPVILKIRIKKIQCMYWILCYVKIQQNLAYLIRFQNSRTFLIQYRFIKSLTSQTGPKSLFRVCLILLSGPCGLADLVIGVDRVFGYIQLSLIFVRTRFILLLPPSQKEYNYGLRATKNVSCLTKFLVNNIYICGFKLIYYKNTFRD